MNPFISSRSQWSFFALLLNLAWLFLSAGSVASGAESAPNVIVIMADDLGYGDVGCYGSAQLDTPNIDRLASEGLRFTNGYCSASTCTPTRYSFLTGTYAFRKANTGIAPPNSPALIAAGTPTIASLMKQAGYATAVIGKWHLGLGEPGQGPQWNDELKPGPLEIGFDHCFLLPTTNDRVPQVYVQDHRVLNLDPNDPLWVGDKKPSPDHPTGISHRDELKMDWSHGHNATIHNGISRIGFYTGGHAARFRDEDLADRWVSESKRWISDHQEQPFFLFFAAHDIHVPRIVHERFQGKSGLGPRGDAIVELDWCVGELMQTVKNHNMEKNTMIVFCSDNGPVLDDGYQDDAIEKLGDHDPNGPYTGGKYSVFEGGTRTPFITWWPGTIQPGVSDKLVCTIDLAASCAAMVSVELPDDAVLDSVNVSDALLGSPAATGRQSLVQQDNGRSGNYGYRRGKWKLLRSERGKQKNVRLRLVDDQVPKYQLFDLSVDPGETNNVIAEYPQIADELKRELAEEIGTAETR
nr:sulfatase-like hydrolase/transferase [Neorhodopirellula pilleata]